MLSSQVILSKISNILKRNLQFNIIKISFVKADVFIKFKISK